MRSGSADLLGVVVLRRYRVSLGLIRSIVPTTGGRADGVDAAGEKHRARFRFLSRLCNEQDAREYGCHVGEKNVISSFKEGAGQDSCFGESGGPVFIRGSADSLAPDGGFYAPPHLFAITSWGLATNAEGYCGRGAINVGLEREEVRI